MNNNQNWQLYSPSTLISKEEELQIIQQVLRHNRKTLQSEPDALDSLLSNYGIDNNHAVQFGLGFVDRSYPVKLLKESEAEREKITGVMTRYGLKTSEGLQTFWGMVICPVFDTNGWLIGAFGYRPKPSRDKPRFLAMSLMPGLFYAHSILQKFSDIIICETPFDVMSLNLMGVENAISVMNLACFDEHHINVLLNHRINMVRLGLSRTSSGDRYRSLFTQKLEQAGIVVEKLEIPWGTSLSHMFSQAEWLRRFKASTLSTAQV